MNMQKLPVAIIGGGPVGLAAAAHLTQRNTPFVLFEAGETVSANILSWQHVKVFSPWRYNIDKAAEALLVATGWQSPDKEELPNGKELVEKYLQPLANHPTLKPHIHVGSKVMAVGRKNMDKMKTNGRAEQPFVLQVQRGQANEFFEASAVIDASGTWQNINPIGSGGVFAFGEMEHQAQIFYGIPDVLGKHQARYKNKSVLVVGGGHSAINTILELNTLKEQYPETEIHWVLRKKSIKEVYGGRADDALPARGALGIKIEQLLAQDKIAVYTPFQIQEITSTANKLTITGLQYDQQKALMGIDEIISNTGTRPDMSFLREVRVDIDSTVESVPALADLIDPNIHSCGSVRPHGEAELRQKEQNFYVVGMKSYGRAPTFLMATGYEQVRSIAAALAGDFESARNVELNLPQTGVCSTGKLGQNSCCSSEASGASCGSEVSSTKASGASCGSEASGASCGSETVSEKKLAGCC